MDDSEAVVDKYLTHRGFKKIDLEPEGKSKPPDFLVDDRIAVEVRRLNQNEACSSPGTKPRGLEEVAIPVWKMIQQLLPSLGPPKGQLSWYVYITFSRPVPDRKQTECAIRQQLGAFRDIPIQKPGTIKIFDNFELELIPCDRPHADHFVMGGHSDYDSGGWIIPELERNLKICIDQKTAKMSGIRSKYAEWWLLLVDHINYGAKETLQVPPHTWDKVILIDPTDHTHAWELK